MLSEDQIFVGVTQEANHVHQLLPMMERMNENLEAARIAERPEPGLGNMGYWSEANVLACSQLDLPELFLTTTKVWKQTAR